MSRAPVVLRRADASDAALVAELWATELAGTEPAAHRAQSEALLDRVLASEDERLIIAEAGSEPVGVVLLRIVPISPLSAELLVEAVAPYVLPDHRRRGVGRALMEAGVAFAEERGVGYLGSATIATSREASRFMARLGLRTQSTVRVAATHVVRAKIAAHGPRPRRMPVGTKPLAQVLAARRSMRRTEP